MRQHGDIHFGRLPKGPPAPLSPDAAPRQTESRTIQGKTSESASVEFGESHERKNATIRAILAILRIQASLIKAR
jgi:hypothetical protein